MRTAGPFSLIRYLGRASRLAFAALREGRLTLSPRRWLLDLRHLRGEMSGGANAVATGSPLDVPDGVAVRTARAEDALSALEAFLERGERLTFASPVEPMVSVLVVLYNRAELTLQCLRAVAEQEGVGTELIIVDNHSTDRTSALLARIDGARIVRSSENLGFLRACNRAAREARGRYLLFLNSDTEVWPGCLLAALHTIEGSESVGAVGGRLVFPDGRLQEAGSMIWNDGSCLGFGRHDSPWLPQYAYVRDVDYCSAAFLMTPQRLFLDLGGFDDRYQPAYYEDADYCVRVWKAGRRVVYNPRAIVTHVEFASSSSESAAVEMQLERRTKFVEVHRDWLEGQVPPSANAIRHARDRHRTGLRVLVVDDTVPHTSVGFGYPRTVAMLRSLVELGHAVTLLPVSVVRESWERVYEDVPPEVEVLVGYGPDRLEDVFRERAGCFDCIVVSRSHNMALLRKTLGEPGGWMPGARVVYDAEAITAVRECARRRLHGEVLSEAAVGELVAAELELARGVDAVLTVSPQESREFQRLGCAPVHIVSHAVVTTPRTRPFDKRAGVLFVGSFHELSPNADAAFWFATEVLPSLRRRMGTEVSLTIVGQDPPEEVVALGAQGVRVLGSVPDLGPLYEAARVFVASTRYAAGIPLKVIHAAANGLPVVGTSLLAEQLEWRDRHELLAADSAEGFAAACAALYQDGALWEHVRVGALSRVSAEYSPGVFRSALSHALPSPKAGAPGSAPDWRTPPVAGDPGDRAQWRRDAPAQ